MVQMPPPSFERPPHLAQALQRIAKQHQAEPADDGIEAAVLDCQALAVRDPGFNVAEARLGHTTLGIAQDLRRQVGREHIANRSNALRDIDCLIAGAGRDIEHMRARLHARHRKHRLRRLAQPGADDGAAVAPALRHSIPLLRMLSLASLGECCMAFPFPP